MCLGPGGHAFSPQQPWYKERTPLVAPMAVWASVVTGNRPTPAGVPSNQLERLGWINTTSYGQRSDALFCFSRWCVDHKSVGSGWCCSWRAAMPSFKERNCPRHERGNQPCLPPTLGRAVVDPPTTANFAWEWWYAVQVTDQHSWCDPQRYFYLDRPLGRTTLERERLPPSLAEARKTTFQIFF